MAWSTRFLVRDQRQHFFLDCRGGGRGNRLHNTRRFAGGYLDRRGAVFCIRRGDVGHLVLVGT